MSSSGFLARPSVQMAPAGVLSLDLARTATGWCYGVPKASPPAFGTWRLPAPTESGRPYAALYNELLDAIDRYAPCLIIYEATLPAGAQPSAHTAEQLIGLAVIVELAAYQHEVDVRKEYPQTVRSQVMGKGNGRITSKQKNSGLIVRWLQEKGYDVEDHNAADAILQWMYAVRFRTAN